MNPETRTLLQVTVDEASIADNIFSVLMGEHVESRKGLFKTTPMTSDSWIFDKDD